MASHPRAQRISLFDFGYGTGRVINHWIEGCAHQLLPPPIALHVVAYDVSSVGLRNAEDWLCSTGYEPTGPFVWEADAAKGYIAGAVRKHSADLSTTVIFVHGCEGQPNGAMRQLALAANDGNLFDLTTSWSSGLGHIPGDNLRRDYFRQLGEITSPLGEIILSLSSTGDLVEVQPEWSKRLSTGDVNGFPIERPGDLVYRTELSQENFIHVFGPELNDYMRAITEAGQYWWVEGLRYPDDEFISEEAEQANYRRVQQANKEKRGRIWNVNDYREFHTVAARRSPMAPLR